MRHEANERRKNNEVMPDTGERVMTHAHRLLDSGSTSEFRGVCPLDVIQRGFSLGDN